MAELISIIVPTFNRPDALDACLRALSRQTDRGFEVVIADDGSDVATAAVINSWVGRLGVPLKHAWHPHDGFRLAEIRNRAIRISDGSYCIFLDGDCLAREDFVATHRGLARAGWFVTGTRVLLSQAMTRRVLDEKIEAEGWTLRRWLPVWLRRGVNRFFPLCVVPLGPLRRLSPRMVRGARGGNLACWRGDLDVLDGFDGAYRGWGREDTDLVIRLVRSGVRRTDGRFGTAVLHLWHEEADRSRLGDNDNMITALRATQRVKALRGLSHIVREVESFRRRSAPQST